MKSLDTFCSKFEKDYNIRVILSPFQEHGEGEHKICHYIQNNVCKDKCIDVIYGLDADMILLGMLSKNSNNTFLMREPLFYNIQSSSEPKATYLYMSIERTMSCVCEQWCSFMSEPYPPSGQCPISGNNERIFIIKCYVVLTFLLGNDFLPNLSYLRLRDNGLETLMNAYRHTYKSHLTHILLENNELNLSFLISLLDTLSLTEDASFEKAEHEYFKRNPPNIMSMIPIHNRNTLTFESKKIEFYPMFHKFTNRLFGDKMQGWRTNYYFHLFDQDPHTSIVTNVCASYIKGLVWCCDYYFKQSTNWAWFYKYNYSPTILDVYNYSSGLNKIPIFTKEDIGANKNYITVDEQLLMVIPPSSKFILYNNDHKQYTSDVTKGLVHLFPVDFDIITYMKSQLHECGGNGINLDEKITI